MRPVLTHTHAHTHTPERMKAAAQSSITISLPRVDGAGWWVANCTGGA